MANVKFKIASIGKINFFLTQNIYDFFTKYLCNVNILEGLNEVISRMPLRSRILYHVIILNLKMTFLKVMPADRQKQLAKHIEKRQNFTTRFVQTDPVIIESNTMTIDPHPDI